MLKAGLFPKSKRAVVAVSGGSDSMLLLYLLNDLKNSQEGSSFLKELVAVHINHGTRPSNFKEEELVKNFCDKVNVNLIIKKLNLNLSLANFEKMARDEREKVFFTYLEDGDCLYQGHNIDDSFEWSLMKSFSSCELKSSLGIPVKRGTICRPLMSMTKSQINYWALKLKVPFLVDDSNFNLKFDRNFMRQQILQMKDRYPQYLKHYVYRSNALAKKLGLIAFKNKESSLVITRTKDSTRIFLDNLVSDLSGYEDEIRQIIHQLSEVKRGAITGQIFKLIKAQKNGKTGPVEFSGGVLAFIFGPVVFFIKKALFVKMSREDKTQLLSYSHIPCAFTLENLKYGPLIVIGRENEILKEARLTKPHPFFQEETANLKSDQKAYAYLGKLLKKMRQKT